MTLSRNADSLEKLNLEGTAQTNVKWLQNKVPNLKELILANNQISDLSPILSMKKLTSLNLSGNTQIKNLAPLTGLTNLHTLDVTGLSQINDLTPLTALTKLKTLNVDKSMENQRNIITSSGSPESKRTQLVSNSISDVKVLSGDNAKTIKQLSASLDNNVQALTQNNQALEKRVADLEAKLSQLNQACFAETTIPSRRRLGDGCIPQAVSSVPAAGLLSVAAATILAMVL